MAGGPINIFEYEALAKERLPQAEYDFIAGGATDELTLRRTRTAFDAIMLRPRMLVDISQPDLSTTVLGQRTAFGTPSYRHGDNNRGRRNLVGDDGFEPTTSTMSTWRSTPELIALSKHPAFACVPLR